ncbi:hypothetical protein EGW08_018075, partial [Elysia chlorotica]
MERNFLLIFSTMFIGYTNVVYDRQSIPYAAPVIAKTENLQNSHLGFIISSQHLGYMIVKAFSGPIADLVAPTILLSASLFFTGVTLASFTVASSVLLFAVSSFLCGFAQGPAWGACAVLLKQLVKPEQFATWWGVLSVSSNIAGTIGPFLSAYLLEAYGWRAAFLTVSTTTMAFSGFAFVVFKLFTYGDAKATDKGSTRQFRDVFSPQLGLVFLSYTLVSLVRGACSDWGQMYLVQSKQQPILVASSFSSSQEIGGIIGSIAAGYVADLMISKNSGNVKPRYAISLFLTVLQTFGLLAFIFSVTAQSSQLWINLWAFMIGFGMYGAIT